MIENMIQVVDFLPQFVAFREGMKLLVALIKCCTVRAKELCHCDIYLSVPVLKSKLVALFIHFIRISCKINTLIGYS